MRCRSVSRIQNHPVEGVVVGSREGREIQGFALIITVSLLVLLAVIAVGLLTLSTVTVRSAQEGKLQDVARANARLSMMLALSELQAHTGPDQRITAPADIISESEVARPHLTGVWRGWKWRGTGTADYSAQKASDFLGWLSSHPDPRSLEDPSFADSAPDSDAVPLVGSGTVPDSGDHVLAERVPVMSGNVEGDYAWVVLDQGQKACLTLPDRQPRALGEELAEFTAPAVPGFQSVQAGGRDWTALEAAGEERLKLITEGQLPLVGVDADSSTFHDLTSHSTGLAVNAAEGGLAKDLSLLFEHSALPESYQRRFLYSDSRSPLANPPNRFRGANVLPSPDPSWALLHSHARLHLGVRDASVMPTLGTKVVARPPAGVPASRALFHQSFHEQQLAPVIANAQFVFSMGIGASPNQSRGQPQPGAQRGENWVLWLVTDPVITLWNPYNVNLTFEKARVDLYRVPLAFEIFRNGRSFAPPTLFANSYLPGDFQGRAKRFYRLNIKPAYGEDGEPEEKITMKPGEHLVFTAHNHVKHYQQQYMLKGVDLRPGWNAPAGNDSSEHIGGISSLNLCVNSSGGSSGRLNGAVIRQIPVKVGDRIEIAVTNARAEIDKLDETNQEEVTSFLKYYVESDGETSGSTPPLVGGIELDYGDREGDILASFSKRELPTIVVPRGIPNNQGDNYVGDRPPPNTRFKEPFLITSLRLKTELDSRAPSRGWIHNAPTNLYASAGLDQTEGDVHHQYEFTWEPMTDWDSTPTIEIDPEDRGFGASGVYAQTGQEFAPFSAVPLAPLTSLAQLRHAPINSGGQLPLQTQVVGNSFAHPLLAGDRVREAGGDRTYMDHSFLANQALFDSYFFSSLGSQRAPVHGQNRSLDAVVEGFLGSELDLPNGRMELFSAPGVPSPDKQSLTDIETGYLTSAAHLGIKGAFNVNSTSVAAWQAILSSLQPEEIPDLEPSTGRLERTRGERTLVSRFLPPVDEQLDGNSDPIGVGQLTWRGHRRLADDQIADLAEEIVNQVKERGPFQSLAEFVNRRPEQNELGVSGALQAAIDATDINADALSNSFPALVDPVTPPAFPEASEGTTADGAPAVINQADLLTALAPVMTVRSDTFVIRAYGEARSGDQVAKAWCEATVQRTPAYLEPGDAPETEPDDLEDGGVNAVFGRRYEIIAFRWLSPKEV